MHQFYQSRDIAVEKSINGTDQLSLNLEHHPAGHYTILVTFDGKVNSGSIIITR